MKNSPSQQTDDSNEYQTKENTRPRSTRAIYLNDKNTFTKLVWSPRKKNTTIYAVTQFAKESLPLLVLLIQRILNEDISRLQKYIRPSGPFAKLPATFPDGNSLYLYQYQAPTLCCVTWHSPGENLPCALYFVYTILFAGDSNL